MSVHIYQITRCYILEDSHVHTRHRDNKGHLSGDPVYLNIFFKNPVRTSNKTHSVFITKINWSTLFRDIFAVCSDNHMNPTSRYTLWAKFKVIGS
jgi:hypothetical protein